MIERIGPFNPLDKTQLGTQVAKALLVREVLPLGAIEPFNGAGVYAIYYIGGFSAYREIARLNDGRKFGQPIYVGKAVPKGARKGGYKPDADPGKVLYKRLEEHAKSIRQVSNLDIKDFFCRYLVVDDIWIPLGESLLIAKFAPVWNTVIDGFGNHDPGKGRYEGMRPRWDVLHPGRSWAEKCKDRPETAKQIAREVEEYLRATPIPSNPRFYAEQSRQDYELE